MRKLTEILLEEEGSLVTDLSTGIMNTGKVHKFYGDDDDVPSLDQIDDPPADPPKDDDNPPADPPPANPPGDDDKKFFNQNGDQVDADGKVIKTKEELAAETADEGEAKVKAFAEKHGGTNLNDQGELVDADGKVLKTAEEVQKLLDEEEQGNDDAPKLFNDKGDQVDKEGKVIKTKEELEAESDDRPFIEVYQEKMGVKILGEDGQPKKYEDTEAGIIEYNKDVVAHQLKETQQNFLDSNPEIKNYYRHLANGGKREDYFREVTDYKNTQLDKDNEAQLLGIIKEGFVSKGITDEKAQKQVDLLKDSGADLFQEATDTLKELVADQEAAEKEAETEQAIAIDKRKKEIREHWGDVKNIVDKGVIKNIAIPEVDKEGFYKYVSQAVNNQGHSQDRLDASKEDLETKLLLSYYRYKGYSLKDLIEAKANEQKVISLRERIKKSKKEFGSGGTKQPIQSDPRGEDVSLDAITG